MSQDTRRKFLIGMVAAAAIVSPAGAIASFVGPETPQQKFGRLMLAFVDEYRTTNIKNLNYIELALNMVSGFDEPVYPEDLEEVTRMLTQNDRAQSTKYLVPNVYSDPVFAIAHVRNILWAEKIPLTGTDIDNLGHSWKLFCNYYADLILRA